MRNLHFLLLPLIAITFLACSEDDSNPAAPAVKQDLMALAVGNHWIYDASLYLDGDLLDTARDTINITGTVIDNAGILWYLDDDGTPYRNSNQGLHVGDEGQTFKYPASPGDFTTLPDDPTVTITVTNIDTTVSTPLGHFRCIKYVARKQNNPYFYFFFYSPGIGLVREELLSTEGGYTASAELSEYYLESGDAGIASRPNTPGNRSNPSGSVFAGSENNLFNLRFSVPKALELIHFK